MGEESKKEASLSSPCLRSSCWEHSSCREQGARRVVKPQDKRTWKQEQIPSVLLKCVYHRLHFSHFLFYYYLGTKYCRNIAFRGSTVVLLWAIRKTKGCLTTALRNLLSKHLLFFAGMPEYRKAALPCHDLKANGVSLLGHQVSSCLPTTLLLSAESGGHHPLNQGKREKVFLRHFKEKWNLFWILVLLPNWTSRNSQNM